MGQIEKINLLDEYQIKYNELNNPELASLKEEIKVLGILYYDLLPLIEYEGLIKYRGTIKKQIAELEKTPENLSTLAKINMYKKVLVMLEAKINIIKLSNMEIFRPEDLTPSKKKVIKTNREFARKGKWNSVQQCDFIVDFDDDPTPHQIAKLREQMIYLWGVDPIIICLTSERDNSKAVNELKALTNSEDVYSWKVSKDTFNRWKQEMY